MVMVGRVGHLLDELSSRYTPANAHLARLNVLSLERALALRRLVIAKLEEPPDELGYKRLKQTYDAGLRGHRRGASSAQARQCDH